MFLCESRSTKYIVAAGLAQVSEFSFVLGSRARRFHLISREVSLFSSLYNFWGDVILSVRYCDWDNKFYEPSSFFFRFIWSSSVSQQLASFLLLCCGEFLCGNLEAENYGWVPAQSGQINELPEQSNVMVVFIRNFLSLSPTGREERNLVQSAFEMRLARVCKLGYSFHIFENSNKPTDPI